MYIKGQDILVCLYILARGWPDSYADMAKALGISVGGAHQSVKRAATAQLLDPWAKWVRRQALAEFLVHGLQYAFPAEVGRMTRGVPTSFGVGELAKAVLASDEQVPVWPDPEGSVRGPSLSPLFKSVPYAALRDPQLHEWLALADAIRSGRARERDLAKSIVTRRLAHGPH